MNNIKEKEMTCLEAGYSEQSIQYLESHFKTMIENERVQCASYLLAKDGKIFAQNAFGKLLYNDEEQRFDLNSIRGIASITKLFTATSIFQLVEKGLIHLNQRVSSIISEFDNSMYNTITIKHLLTHTSGIIPDSGYFLETYPVNATEYRKFYEPEQQGNMSEEEQYQVNKSWIKTILATRPVCKPGEQWNYCSHGFRFLGEIIERISGMSYEDYLKEHIFEPLQLTRTFISIPEHLIDEVCVVNEQNKKYLIRQISPYYPPAAGGGISSTAYDLFRFGQMLINKGSLDGVQIVSRKSVEKMMTNVLGEGLFAYSWGGKNPKKTFGLGAEPISSEYYSEHVFGHEGSGRVKLMLDKERQAVMLFFVPSQVDWCPESIIGTENIIGAGWL